MGRDALPGFFVDQAKAGVPIGLPAMIPNANSSKGHLGEFRSQAGCNQYRCRVSQHLEAGTLFFMDQSTVQTSYNLDGTIASRRPQTTTRGPFLLASDRYRHLPDDAAFLPDGAWQITGTFEYPTILGVNKAVWKLEPCDVSDIAIPDDPRLLLGEPRQWSDRSGKFTAQAIYLGYDQGTVQLLRIDGEEIEVKLKQISNEDRKFVRAKILETKEVAAAENLRAGY
jgi:hypothetical protein